MTDRYDHNFMGRLTPSGTLVGGNGARHGFTADLVRIFGDVDKAKTGLQNDLRNEVVIDEAVRR